MLEAGKLLQKAAKFAISARYKAELVAAHLYVQEYLDPALVQEVKAILREHVNIPHGWYQDLLNLIIAEIAVKN